MGPRNETADAVPETGWTPKTGQGWTGEAFITNVEENQPNGDNATFTVDFTGTGPLTKVPTVISLIPSPRNLYGCGGFYLPGSKNMKKKITINKKKYALGGNHRAMMIWEAITGKAFDLKLLGNSRPRSMWPKRLRQFLRPRVISARGIKKKTERHRGLRDTCTSAGCPARLRAGPHAAL